MDEHGSYASSQSVSPTPTAHDPLTVPGAQDRSVPGPGSDAPWVHVAPARPAWASLPRRAKVFRVAHVAWGIAALSCLGYIWICALMRRHDRYLGAASGFLLVQGVALLLGRGNCPLGPFQRRLGDPVPMFELALPPKAAKAAIPVLAIVAVLGMIVAALRPPRERGGTS